MKLLSLTDVALICKLAHATCQCGPLNTRMRPSFLSLRSLRAAHHKTFSEIDGRKESADAAKISFNNNKNNNINSNNDSSNNFLHSRGLAEVPMEESDSESAGVGGVHIDNTGRIRLVNTAAAKIRQQQPHDTALVLEAAPASLTERDFIRVLGGGEHFRGWRSRGGLRKIIPIRYPDTLNKRRAWALIFDTPANAHEYQAKVLRLNRIARRVSPPNPTGMKTTPPPNFPAKDAAGFASADDYSLGPAWLQPFLHAYLAPFDQMLQGSIHRHEALARNFAVRVWIDEFNYTPLSRILLGELLRWDGNARGSHWQLIEGRDSIVQLESRPQHGMDGSGAWLPRKDNDDDKDHNDENDDEAPNQKINNWCLLFESSLEAKRFVRTWHRRPLPRFESLPFADPQPLLKAECLFSDDVL